MSITSVSRKLPASRLTWRHAGETLDLIPVAVQDAKEVVEAIVASRSDLKRHMTWAHIEPTLEAQRERCAAGNASYWRGGDAVFALRDQAGTYLGSFGLHPRALSEQALEIGFWVAASAAGRGLATSATRVLIVYGFDYLHLTRVQCSYNITNVRSARVQAKCGFREEARLRNFDTPATPELRRAGYEGGDVTVLSSLIPSDLPSLPWLAETRSALTVYDWLGTPVPRPA